MKTEILRSDNGHSGFCSHFSVPPTQCTVCREYSGDEHDLIFWRYYAAQNRLYVHPPVTWSDSEKFIPFWPYCKVCKHPYEFESEEPFAYCQCGTTEWGYPRPYPWVQEPDRLRFALAYMAAAHMSADEMRRYASRVLGECPAPEQA